MRYQLNAFCLAQSRTKISIIKRIDLVKIISIYDKWLYILIHTYVLDLLCNAITFLRTTVIMNNADSVSWDGTHFYRV